MTMPADKAIRLTVSYAGAWLQRHPEYEGKPT